MKGFEGFQTPAQEAPKKEFSPDAVTLEIQSLLNERDELLILLAEFEKVAMTPKFGTQELRAEDFKEVPERIFTEPKYNSEEEIIARLYEIGLAITKLGVPPEKNSFLNETGA